jgi:hypothetical protein
MAADHSRACLLHVVCRRSVEELESLGKVSQAEAIRQFLGNVRLEGEFLGRCQRLRCNDYRLDDAAQRIFANV